LVEELQAQAALERQRADELLERLRREKEEELRRLGEEHEQELVELTKRLEGDLTHLNDMLLTEKEDHVMTKMTKEEKIKYLAERIAEFRQRMASIEQENSRLNLNLLAREQELRDLEASFEERVRQRALEFE
jgi:hypothetical protein